MDRSRRIRTLCRASITSTLSSFTVCKTGDGSVGLACALLAVLPCSVSARALRLRTLDRFARGKVLSNSRANSEALFMYIPACVRRASINFIARYGPHSARRELESRNAPRSPRNCEKTSFQRTPEYRVKPLGAGSHYLVARKPIGCLPRLSYITFAKGFANPV